MKWTDMWNCLPDEISEIAAEKETDLRELRLRAGKRTELVHTNGREFIGCAINAELLRKAVLRMMDYSFYAREDELAQGYFTMKNGFRVGVCGSFYRSEDGTCGIRSIGSACIRIAREIPGCATQLVNEMTSSGTVENALIISRPGFGKTTMLRDAARLLSECGYEVAIADERHEIAACHNGIPTLNVGERTDVMDGCAKYTAMGMMVRSMAPHVLIADEIGCEQDITAIMDASTRGVAVLSTAHAACLEDLEKGPLRRIMRENIFQTVVLLDESPGTISEIRHFERRRKMR